MSKLLSSFETMDKDQQLIGSVQGAVLVVLAHENKKTGEPIEFWQLMGRVAFLLVRAYPPIVAEQSTETVSHLLDDAVTNLYSTGMIDLREEKTFVLGETVPDFLPGILDSMTESLKDMDRILIDSGVESMRRFFDANPDYADRFALSIHQRITNPETAPS